MKGESKVNNIRVWAGEGQQIHHVFDSYVYQSEAVMFVNRFVHMQFVMITH